MKYRRKPVLVDAAQWDPTDPKKAGEVLGILIASHAEYRQDGEEISVVQDSGSCRVVPGRWVVAEDGEIAVYQDADFRDRYDATRSGGGGVVNSISGGATGTVIQTGGDLRM